jgi:hypothetical protein
MKKFYQKGSGQKQKGGYIGWIRPAVKRHTKKMLKWDGKLF